MIKNFTVLLFCSIPFRMLAQVSSGNSAKLSFGTTMLAFLTPDTAWLASDTKVGEVNTDKQDTTYLQQTKIFKNENAYYGFCGISLFNSTDGISFEPKIILDSLLKSKKTLKEVSEIFNEISFKKVNEIANWLYRNSTNEYNQNIGITLFEYIILRFENKNLQCFTVAYEIDSMPIDSKKIRKSKDYFYTGDTTMFFIGYTKEIREDLSNGLYRISFFNIRNDLPCLIKKEASLYMTKVGMPVEEFIIHNNGDLFLRNLDCFKTLALSQN